MGSLTYDGTVIHFTGEPGAAKINAAIERTPMDDFLKGGELVLTTGMPLPEESAGIQRYVDELARIGAAALVTRGPDSPVPPASSGPTFRPPPANAGDHLHPSVEAGVGKGVPAHVMTNHDFAAIGIDTSHEWIVERTGIVERHIAGEGDSTCSMAAEASISERSMPEMRARTMTITSAMVKSVCAAISQRTES